MANYLAAIGGIIFILCIMSLIFGSGDFAKFIGRTMVGMEQPVQKKCSDQDIQNAVESVLEERKKR